VTIKFPEKLAFLFRPARYKCAYGGRGSAKSWSFARALLIRGTMKRERILCTREVQKSIQQSVHQLLRDQIDALGLGGFYEVLQNEIRGKNGTSFHFSGLSDQTADSIKSFEGCTIVWVEEAHSVTARSWNILTPTIRADGSEIWVTFNPVLDTDETYVRFVINPPPDCVSAQVNYHDNPWFPKVLEDERAHCERTNPRDYPNIWLGKCKPAVDGAIYAEEIADAVEGGRIANVPVNPKLKVHTIWDLGWNDSMSIILVQKQASAIHVVGFLQDDHRTYDYYSAELRKNAYNWGACWLPHDGEHKNPITGTSPKETLEGLSWRVDITPNIPIEHGITAARRAFPQTYFDKGRAGELIECLKRYRQKINVNTGVQEAPIHDKYSHGADAYRYLAIVADQLTNEEWGGKLNYPHISTA
jgi:phage terminase large subunit